MCICTLALCSSDKGSMAMAMQGADSHVSSVMLSTDRHKSGPCSSRRRLDTSGKRHPRWVTSIIQKVPHEEDLNCCRHASAPRRKFAQNGPDLMLGEVPSSAESGAAHADAAKDEGPDRGSWSAKVRHRGTNELPLACCVVDGLQHSVRYNSAQA